MFSRVDVEIWKADLEFFFWATESLMAFFWSEPFDGWLQDQEKDKRERKGMNRRVREITSVVIVN